MADIVACPSCGKKNRIPVSATGSPRCAGCKTDLPWLVDVVDEHTFGAATQTRLPVLVDMWAPWCGPCRTIAPGVARAAVELAGDLKVVKVNVDKAPGISARFGVQGIPTLLILRDGKAVARQVGALPPDQLLDWVRSSVSTE